MSLRFVELATAALSFAVVTSCSANEPVQVVLETSLGNVTLELYPAKAPESVKNFLAYVDAGFYANTLFHRVIPGFVVQGGGYEPGFKEKPTKAPIKNEAGNGLNNARGTISMARTQVVDSATSQFFISVADNGALDHRDNTPRGFGYAVFGKVVEGMDVVDKIVSVQTTRVGPFEDVPRQDVLILSAKRK
jgi:peptidyl-prolyl cis-trans isomerase A (cyclophilin A)